MSFQRHGTNHEVTITLFSRLFYKANSIHEFPEYMRENVQQDFRNMFYEDFYKWVSPFRLRWMLGQAAWWYYTLPNDAGKCFTVCRRFMLPS